MYAMDKGTSSDTTDISANIGKKESETRKGTSTTPDKGTSAGTSPGTSAGTSPSSPTPSSSSDLTNITGLPQEGDKKVKKGSGVIVFIIVLMVIIAIVAIALIVHYAIRKKDKTSNNGGTTGTTGPTGPPIPATETLNYYITNANFAMLVVIDKGFFRVINPAAATIGQSPINGNDIPSLVYYDNPSLTFTGTIAANKNIDFVDSGNNKSTWRLSTCAEVTSKTGTKYNYTGGSRLEGCGPASDGIINYWLDTTKVANDPDSGSGKIGIFTGSRAYFISPPTTVTPQGQWGTGDFMPPSAAAAQIPAGTIANFAWFPSSNRQTGLLSATTINWNMGAFTWNKTTIENLANVAINKSFF